MEPVIVHSSLEMFSFVLHLILESLTGYNVWQEARQQMVSKHSEYERTRVPVFQLGLSMASITVSSLLLFGFETNCRLLSLCPLPSRPSSLDCWASQRLRRQFRDIRPVFISHSSTFLSVCGTWIYRLLPALNAHLPCTTLLNSEECALLEKKRRRCWEIQCS